MTVTQGLGEKGHGAEVTDHGTLAEQLHLMGVVTNPRSLRLEML